MIDHEVRTEALKTVHLLLSATVRAAVGARLQSQAEALGVALVAHVPGELSGPAGEKALSLIEAAFVSPDVLGDSSKAQLTPEMADFCHLLDRAPSLSWVQIPSSGWDRPQFIAWKRLGITLCNATGIASVAVAQSALAGLLALSRQLPIWMEAQRRRAWEPLRGAREPAILEGQTAVIVGLGAIGQEIARLCRALRMRVVGVSQSGVDHGDVCDEVHRQEHMQRALGEADWLLLSCPLTVETQGLMNTERFGQLKRGAGLVDVSRGGVVPQKALESALDDGTVASAYLDVVEFEPLPPSASLWSRPNVLVSPHYAGDFRGRQEKLAALFCNNVERYLKGQALINPVP
jgi:D-2-hydroxyacid dehydrogenase (NADP+)